MKLLIAGMTSHSVFVKWLKQSLEADGWLVDVYHFNNPFYQKSSKIMGTQLADKLSLGIFLIICWIKNSGRFDRVSLNFASVRYVPVLSLFRRFSRKTILTTWGSDFYQAPPQHEQQLRSLYHLMDGLIFTNAETAQECMVKFALAQKNVHVARLPLLILDMIDQLEIKEKRAQMCEKMDFPLDKIIVTCGTNASPHQNHQRILDGIMQVENEVLEQCHFLFPVTYGAQNNLQDLYSRLITSGLSFSFVNRMLSDQQVARLRLTTDLLINLQDTDQLSGAMQESLYCSSEVITAEWLPYELFAALPNVHRIADFSELAQCFKNTVELLALKEKKYYPETKALIANLSRNSEAIERYKSVFIGNGHDLSK